MHSNIPWYNRLTSKFAGIILFLIILPQIFIYLFISNTTAQVMTDVLRENLKEKAFLVAADIDRFFDQRLHDARIISQADVLEHNNIEQIIQYFTEITQETPFLNDIDIINMQGIIFASSGEQNEKGKHIGDYYPELDSLFYHTQNARQGEVFVSQVMNLDSGPGLVLLTPITDEANTTVIKVLLIEINLNLIRQLVKDFDDRVIGDKYVYLVDNDGRIIVSGDPATALFDTFPDLEIMPALLKNFSSQGDVGSVIYTDIHNDEVMAGFADMSEFGINQAMDWSIIAIAPLDEIISPFNSLKNTILIQISIVLLLGVISMYLLSHSIIHAVNNLVSSSKKIGAGNISHRITATKNNEFGYLAEVINATLNNLANARHETEMANNKLTHEKELLNVTLHSIGDGVITTDIQGNVITINLVSEQLTGWRKEEAAGKPLTEVFNIVNEKTRQPCENPVNKVIKTGGIVELENHTILISKQNKEHHIADSAAPIIDLTGALIGVVLVFRDVTELILTEREQEKLHEMLQHKSRMDAIGQLAGGVAHDFNNMLGGIMGAASILQLPKRGLNQKSLDCVNIILEAATRAADLTEKLMAFGRKGKILSTTLDIHIVIDDAVSILTKSIDKNIALTVHNNAKESGVVGDSTGIQNALMNLGINASHAMKQGGELTIETQNIYLDQEYCTSSTHAIEPGKYIMIIFRDTGTGIDSEIITQIFDPFFTTKKQGDGTGLGLSSVYGTIQDHHGSIEVYSEVKKGTVFHLYFPVSKMGVTAQPHEIAHEIPQETGNYTGTIILVDDEHIIRVIGKNMLEELGFTVHMFEDGYAALDYFKKEYAQIDLVITDMIMPKIKGSELFYKLKAIDPHCKIILSSGFVKDEDINTLNKDGLSGFIMKPFRNSEMIALLDTVLGDNHH